jgi:hypothetical protein
MINLQEGNLRIKSLLSENKPFVAGKMGAVEQQIMIYKYHNKPWDNNLRWHASNHAGVTPPTDEILNFFTDVYTEALNNTDLLSIWFPENINSMEYLISEHYCKNAEFMGGLQSLEPFYFDEPWSEELKDKKVLVVHPFEESIRTQYLIKDKIFENQKVLPNFDLITFKTYQTHGGGNTDLPWDYCLNDMNERISKIEFDVALVACGAYGLPVCSHIKNMGKPAIHVGGGLQIMFGIKGNRWDNMAAVNKYYNQYWKRPFDSEKPRNHSVVEGSTYW